MTSATPNRDDQWRFVADVKNATYVAPDGTSYSNVKSKIGAYTAGDFASGVGASVPRVMITVWPKASTGNNKPGTIVPEGTLTIDSVTYQVIQVVHKRIDGSQVVVECFEQQ